MKPNSSPTLVLPTVWAGRSSNPLRGRRILPESGGYFVHVTSRAVQQRFLIGEEEKAAFVDLMRRWADFSGLIVLTHCMMDNHVHMMIWVPPVQQVGYGELVRRIRRVWPAEKVGNWVRYYESLRAGGRREMREALTRRMHDLPAFMRVLKQSFSVWYNELHGVSGTFWEGRYRSMVLKDAPDGLMRVSAYIDLNPMRAGICGKPEGYSWSGYGRACGGDREFQRGVQALVSLAGCMLPPEASRMCPGLAGAPRMPLGWEEAERVYRAWLYAVGRSVAEDPNVSEKRRLRGGFDSLEVMAACRNATGAQKAFSTGAGRCWGVGRGG